MSQLWNLITAGIRRVEYSSKTFSILTILPVSPVAEPKVNASPTHQMFTELFRQEVFGPPLLISIYIEIGTFSTNWSESWSRTPLMATLASVT